MSAKCLDSNGVDSVGHCEGLLRPGVAEALVAVDLRIDALAGHANLVLATGGLVIDIHMGAAALYRAAIGGAGVRVVAVDRLSRLAGFVGAMVVGGASVAVIAGDVVGVVHASCIGVAGIVGAEIVVIAVYGGTGNARAVGAGIVRGAKASILAGGSVGGSLAPGLEITSVVGAGVVVAANDGCARSAPTFRAMVILCAGILVITGTVVEGKLAARFRQT